MIARRHSNTDISSLSISVTWMNCQANCCADGGLWRTLQMLQLLEQDSSMYFEQYSSSNLGNIVEMKTTLEGNKLQNFTQKLIKEKQ